MKYLPYISMILVFLLILSFGYENNNLRKELYSLENLRKEHQVFLGRKVQSLKIKNKNQETISINFSEQKLPTIIYVFSPYCHWCEKNWQNASALYKETKGSYNFIALSIDRDCPNKDIVDNNDKFPFQVYYNPSIKNYEDYFFRVTPATYVVSTDSQIIHYWSGAFDDKIKSNIELNLNIKLPDVVE